MSCPTCRGDVPAQSPCRPFCSPRCRSADLAKWLGGDYRLPGDYVDPEILLGVAAEPIATEPVSLRSSRARKPRERH